MKLKMKGLLKQTEFYVFCIIVAFALIIQVRFGLFFTSNNLMDLVRSMICLLYTSQTARENPRC